MELPEGWIETTLETVAQWSSGGTPSRADPSNFGGGIPWIKTGELGKTVIKATEETLSEKGLRTSSAKVFKAGSVAVAMYGATIGRASILGIDAATNQACAVAAPNLCAINSKYLLHFLNSQQQGFIEAGQGGAQPNISQGIIKSWRIQIPPLAEQKRVADKLDALLARVDGCRAHLERVPGILKQFRQAVLAEAMSGRLTEGWDADRRWKECSLGQALSDIRYGTAKKSQYNLPGGVPVLRIPNIGDLQIDATDLKFGEFEEGERQTLSLRAGDVLFIRSNGSVDLVGKVAVVDEAFEGYVFAGYLIRLRVDKSMLAPKFLALALSAPHIRSHIVLTARSTSGVNNINSDEIRAIQVSLPPLPEQHEIVRRVELLFGWADRLEARVAAARQRVDHLTPALLAKAFRGELVPQDPADEPASVLLERIRKEREGEEGKRSRRGRRAQGEMFGGER